MSRKMEQAAETIAKALREQGPLPQSAEGLQLAYVWNPTNEEMEEITRAGVYPVTFSTGEDQGSSDVVVHLVIGPLDGENGKFPEIVIEKISPEVAEKYHKKIR